MSKLVFNVAPSALKFADSSAETWSGFLVIQNWRSMETLFFVGANNAGLTPDQLRRIIFEQPAGFPPGDYLAGINADGEVVPATRVNLTISGGQQSVRLDWPAPYYLYSTTNLTDWIKIEAWPPFRIMCSEPQRYFRLGR